MKRSKFSLSHYKLLTMKMGNLVPINHLEVLPGDSIQLATSALVRTTPLVSPPMHPCHVRIHHWFVPYRILWTNWENFITGGPDGLNASVFPTIGFAGGSVAAGSLFDYLGVPPGTYGNTDISALPLRAYALIFNEWYRDEDLTTPLNLSLADGQDTTTSTTVQNCCWEKDYFTSSRPWTQKGSVVSLPLGTTAPVKWDGVNPTQWTEGPDALKLHMTAGNANAQWSGVPGGSGDVHIDGSNSGMVADLANASAVNINTLRHALALQRYEEARARYGSRYTEYLRYLGVRSSDARLQRPEYLGGGKQTIQFSEVLQTATGGGGVATMFGHGINATRSNRFRRFFEEHGLILSLMSVKPITVYANALPKTWIRRSKEDFFQKELQFIGQQAVTNIEIYGPSADRVNAFSYQDRYDEYRRHESQIAGQFRNTYNSWHFARNFGSTPTLNSSFVTCTPAVTPFADQGNDNLLVMASHSIQSRRIVARGAEPRTF